MDARADGLSSKSVGLQSWNRWTGACAWLGVVLYAAFLLTAPLAHHHVLCDRSSPAHCPACVADQPGPDVPLLTDFVATELPLLGPVVVRARLAGDAWLPPLTIGRAPPFLSA